MTRLTLDLTANQLREIEDNAKSLGWTKAHYLRTAVAVVEALSNRKGRLFIQDATGTQEILMPGGLLR